MTLALLHHRHVRVTCDGMLEGTGVVLRHNECSSEVRMDATHRVVLIPTTCNTVLTDIARHRGH